MNTMPPGERVREPRLSRKEMDFGRLSPTGSPLSSEGHKTPKGAHGRDTKRLGNARASQKHLCAPLCPSRAPIPAARRKSAKIRAIRGSQDTPPPDTIGYGHPRTQTARRPASPNFFSKKKITFFVTIPPSTHIA